MSSPVISMCWISSGWALSSTAAPRNYIQTANLFSCMSGNTVAKNPAPALKDSMYIHNGRCFYAELLDGILVQLLRSAKSYMSSVN